MGDAHPLEGDWVQSAKADLPDEDNGVPRLLLLGRAFLIYSMYHARQPRFLGYAVENFGAACMKLGYCLPLHERDAVWLPYGAAELDPASAEDHIHLFDHLAKVFGIEAARTQAALLGFTDPILR